MKLLVILGIVVGLAGVASAEPSAITPEAFADQMGGVPSAGDLATWGVGVAQSFGEFVQANRELTTFDATCIDTSNAGAPETPSACASSSPYTPGVAGGQAGGACGECFTRAIRQVNGMRLNLERLRCTYSAYSRYVKASVSFGDSASGIHAVTGLAWQNARAEIMAEFENLKHAYDQKYDAMMPNFRGALDALAKCEADYVHEPDWYQKFGFIYYTFMADRYKRAD